MSKLLYSGFLLVWFSIATCTGQVRAAESFPEDASAIRFAASQHEIISILLEEGDFDLVLPEFEKILALGLKGDKEQLVVQETWLVVSRLIEMSQLELGHSIVDACMEATEMRENQFTLLMLKGKLYKEEGLLDKAVDTFRQAQSLRE